MAEDVNPFKRRFERERAARKEAENILEQKSLELWELNQSLEQTVKDRTIELEKALHLAEIASKSKDDFLSNMSHEIRTPLNAIIGFVEILSKSEYNKDNFDNFFQIIMSTGEDLVQIINDILDFSKIQSGKFTIHPIEVDLRTRLQNACDLFSSRTAEKEITYRLDFDKNIPQYAKVDDIRIIQVLSNFLSNAIKFTPEYGSITVNISFDTPMSLLSVHVVDTGIGMNTSAIEKVFGAFEQADSSTTREFGGTGLGLSISKSLIELMGGEVTLTSEKDVGSDFGFRIPIIAVDSIKDEPVAMQEDSLQVSGKILVAEDNLTNQILIEALLDHYNLDCTIVKNGEEAVKAVKDNHYDLVFMDNQMPVLSGIDATKQIREFNKDISIIALSANALKREQAVFLESGMNDTLAKPIDTMEFEKILFRFLKSYLDF